MQTSPFTGVDYSRVSVEPGQPPGTTVFGGQSGNPNAFAFLEGFLRPANTADVFTDEGALPSTTMFNFNSGDVGLGDVQYLSPAETQLVAQYPKAAKAITDALTGPWGVLIWAGIFFGLVAAFKQVKV